MNTLRPVDESRRLDALRRYAVLDTPPEPALDELTTLASQICAAPVSLISLVDDERQWIKSAVGLTATTLPRDTSFCGHAILQPDIFLVSDAALDERFAASPLVAGDSRIRFYAGAPLVTPGGHAVGTFCVMDRTPRQLTAAQCEALRVLSRQVIAQLEMRRQARELIESELRLFKVLRNCPVAVTVVRWKDRTFVDANVAFSRLTGWSRDDVIGKTTDEVGLVDPTVRDRLRARLEAFHMLRDADAILRTRSGERRHVLFGTGFVELSTGPHAISTMVDITERKRAEAAQRESLERFQIVARATNDAVWDWNLHTDAVWWNEGFRTLFGFTADEIEPGVESWVNRLHPDDVERVRRGIHTVIEGEGQAWSDEYRFRRGNGSYADIFDRGYVLRDVSGRAVRMIGAMQDITERRQLEGQLRESQKMEAIGQLAGRVAHDLTNVLAAVMMRTDLAVVDATLSAEVLDALGEIRSGAEHAASLTRELRAFSQGHVPPFVADTDTDQASPSETSRVSQNDVVPVLEEAAPPSRGSTTILLAEDEPHVRRLTRLVLEREGYHVLEAAHGVEALQLWEQHESAIDLVLADIVMPDGIGGRDLASRLQARRPALPVVFMSGYSRDVAVRELPLGGRQSFLQKPFSPPQLLQAIRRGLGT